MSEPKVSIGGAFLDEYTEIHYGPEWCLYMDQDPASPTYGRQWVEIEYEGIRAKSSRSTADAWRNWQRKKARRA